MTVLDCLRDAVSSLLRKREGDVKAAVAVRGRNERIDALVRVVREAYAEGTFCYLGGALSFFDGMSYAPVSEKDLLTVTRNVLVGMGVSPSDLRVVGSMPLDVVAERQLPPDRSHVCFSNCVLAIDGRKVMRFSPAVKVSERLPYRYDRDAGCPEWLRFLEWALPDPGERACLQEFCGLCYIDRDALSVEKFAILIGSGANGKSVFCSVVSAAMGLDNVSTLDPQQLSNEKMIPYVVGKRLNCAPDVKASSAFDSALKALASGQTVTGRRIFTDAVSVKCPPIIFSLNRLPFFRDTSDGFFRRLLVFRFERTVGADRQDRSLSARIVRNEISGVLNWILDGRDRLLSGGGAFTPSAKMERTLAEVREMASSDEEPVLTWLRKKGYETTSGEEGRKAVRISATDIFDALGGRVSKTAISQELARAGVRMVRNREMYYYVYERR